jgi:hypothetical protein
MRLAKEAVDMEPDINTNEFLKSSLTICSFSAGELVS